MSLLNEFGRYDRSSVQQRAREIRAARPMEWGQALTLAYREAYDELHPPAAIAIRQREAANA